MEYVAKTNDLEMDQDIKYLEITHPQNYTDYLLQYPNQTYLGVIFCNTKWPYTDQVSVPCQFETKTSKKMVFYNLVYNTSHFLNSPLGASFKVAFPKDFVATQLKLSLDNGILAYFSKATEEITNKDTNEYSNTPLMDIEVQDFPKLAFRFWQGSDIVSTMGAFQFFIPYIVKYTY